MQPANDDLDQGTREEAGQIHPPIGSLLDALSFRVQLLAAVNERSGNIYFRDTLGLRLNEWRVLGVTQAMQPLEFDNLRRMLVMDKGQLSRTLRALVERGLIETTPLKTDARKLSLRTTDQGRALHDEALELTRQRNEATVETLSKEECLEFQRLLNKMIAHNRELAEIAGHAQ
jgi:DNA-binding MarR family transcriptional regulator